MNHEQVTYDYDVEVDETRRFCDTAPMVHVALTERITTTTRHDDGSTTTHETQPIVVGSWTYQRERE